MNCGRTYTGFRNKGSRVGVWWKKIKNRSIGPGAYIGFDIFFVISGFLITGLLVEDLEKREFSFAGFYARRIRRIFSALVVVLLVCLVAGWLLLPPRLFGLEYIWGRGLFG